MRTAARTRRALRRAARCLALSRSFTLCRRPAGTATCRRAHACPLTLIAIEPLQLALAALGQEIVTANAPLELTLALWVTSVIPANGVEVPPPAPATSARLAAFGVG